MDPATTDPAPDAATDPARSRTAGAIAASGSASAEDAVADPDRTSTKDAVADPSRGLATDAIGDPVTAPKMDDGAADPAWAASSDGRRDQVRSVPWRQGWWLNRPPHVAISRGRLVVRAARGSDAWRTTSYGFIRDSAHALLSDCPDGWAVQVSFLADFDRQFDQAGILVRIDERRWVKAGVEFCDGFLQASAVVTDDVSDWSVAWAPDWVGSEITVRVSRSGDALTFRIRREDEPWRLLRLAPIDPDAVAYAGPYCAAPERDGLTVSFTRWAAGPADERLHGD